MSVLTSNDAAGPCEVFPAPVRSSFFRDARETIVHDVRELVQFWPVVSNMVSQELRVKYHRSVLGFLWTLLNPILMMTTMAVVFSQIFRMEIKGYAILLFSGLVPFTFISTTLPECSLCIVANESLIRRIYLPKLIFPLVRVLHNVIILTFSLVALFLLLYPLGARFSLPMLLLPIVMALWAAFGLGLGLLVATMNTFFRDCSHLMTVFLQIWYFMTPILYPASMFGERQWVFRFNPAYPFIRLFQMTIHEGAWPDLMTLGTSAAIAAAALGLGYAVFKAHEDKLVFRL